MALKRWGASVDFIRCSTSPFHPFVGFLFKSPVKNLTWNLEEIRLLKHLRKRVDGPSNTCSPKARLAVGEVVQFVAFSGWWFWRKETTREPPPITSHCGGSRGWFHPKKWRRRRAKPPDPGSSTRRTRWQSQVVSHFPRRSVGLMKGCYFQEFHGGS